MADAAKAAREACQLEAAVEMDVTPLMEKYLDEGEGPCPRRTRPNAEDGHRLAPRGFVLTVCDGERRVPQMLDFVKNTSPGGRRQRRGVRGEKAVEVKPNLTTRFRPSAAKVMVDPTSAKLSFIPSTLWAGFPPTATTSTTSRARSSGSALQDDVWQGRQ